ncbi:DUF6415 family natural product biosynthesis protein [Streptomyces blattellae]|uniref:DUF6415 family natural product biosynthesis protein n=1 Tax=Streptomyces blattellae TaxID=2569855 RepID=UPI001E64642D|nr:DUF6415 family natural product biosynthesis protein [Streptomyces blattellae]
MDGRIRPFLPSVDMPHRTALPLTPEEADGLPLDIAAMRASARRLLVQDAEPISPEDLGILAVLLRDHIQQLIPEVEAATLGLPKDDIPLACALACVGEARMRLRLGAGDTAPVRLSVAVKLSRSVNALCDHLVNLGGDHT